MGEIMTKECRRFAKLGRCERKVRSGSCPTGGTWCSSEYKDAEFNPIEFFAQKNADRMRLLRETEVLC